MLHVQIDKRMLLPLGKVITVVTYIHLALYGYVDLERDTSINLSEGQMTTAAFSGEDRRGSEFLLFNKHLFSNQIGVRHWD